MDLVDIAKAAEDSRPKMKMESRIAGDSASELYAAAKRLMKIGGEHNMKKAKRLLAEAEALGQVEHNAGMKAKKVKKSLSRVAKESQDFAAAREDGGRAAHLYARAMDAKKAGDMAMFKKLMAEAKKMGADEHKRDRDAGANFEKAYRRF